MRKRSISLLLIGVLILALSLSGCGQKKDTGSTGQIDTGTKQEKVELRVSWWGSEARHNNTLEAIQLYEELNPHVKIIPEYQGWDGYHSKLTAQVMAGNAPDIFSNLPEWYPELLDADGMADLTDMIDVSGHNIKYVEASSADGKMYGVNLSVNAKVLIANKTLLDEYGIELIEGDYTWEDLADKMVEVYEKTDGEVYGLPDFSVVTDGMGAILLQDYGNTKLGIEGPFPYDNEKYTIVEEQLQEYFQFWTDLREKNGVAPPELSSINDFSANSLLMQRKVAFEMNYAGTFERFQEQTKDDLVMLPLPVGANGEIGDHARPGIIFSVAKNSKHVEEAAKFIDFFTNSPEAAKILRTCRGVLPTEVQREAMVSAGDLVSDTDKKVMAIVDEVMKRELIPVYALPSGNLNLQLRLPEIGQEIAFGKISVEEGAAKLMKEMLEFNK